MSDCRKAAWVKHLPGTSRCIRGVCPHVVRRDVVTLLLRRAFRGGGLGVGGCPGPVCTADVKGAQGVCSER